MNGLFIVSKRRIIIKLTKIILIVFVLLTINIKGFGEESIGFKELQFLYSTPKDENFSIIWVNNRVTILPKMVYAFVYSSETPYGKVLVSVELKAISYLNTGRDNPKVLLRTRFYSQKKVEPENLYLYTVSGLRQNIFNNDTRTNGKLPDYYGQPKQSLFINEPSIITNINAYQSCFEFNVCSYQCLRDYSINIFYNKDEYVIFVDDNSIKSVIDVYLSAIDENLDKWEDLSRKIQMK